MKNNNHFDLLIIGGGHAGCEAAWIASQFNLKIGLISMKGVPLASAPCNPAIGGVGKGQVVREIDALGGLIGKLADLAGIQYRLLNESKGYALQSTRVQIDKIKYSEFAEKLISENGFIQVIREKLLSFDLVNNEYLIKTDLNNYSSTKLIITTGTFLNGKLHCGKEINSGGRLGCDTSSGLTKINSKIKSLKKRFKTGTPPRLDRETIDFKKLIEQKSDLNVPNFHWNNLNKTRNLTQVSCYLSHTNVKMMDLIRKNIDLSPVFNGQIDAVGPRYCPSIEDKAFRYPDRNIHHVFIEPEGLDIDSFYPNGLSTSLPIEIQQEFINCMDGLENTIILQKGYAVEYDVIDTTTLDSTLQVIDCSGLYFAGQVNGTSGYEEAAAQGFVAGVNAVLNLMGRDKLIFSRFDSYIGVLIEDLVTKQRDEPYRLFAARSENRLYIREDNSIIRMCPYRTKLGLVQKIDKHNKTFLEYYNLITEVEKKTSIFQSDYLKLKDPICYIRDELNKTNLSIPNAVIKAFAIEKKYEGYINRLNLDLNRLKKMANKKINWLKLAESKNISFECKQRIECIKPETFGELKNINGIRQATLLYVSTSI